MSSMSKESFLSARLSEFIYCVALGEARGFGVWLQGGGPREFSTDKKDQCVRRRFMSLYIFPLWKFINIINIYMYMTETI